MAQEVVEVVYNRNYMQNLNKTFFKFLIGFIAIILASFTVTFLIGYFDKSGQASNVDSAL